MGTSGERGFVGEQVASVVVAPANPAAGADWSFVVVTARQLLAVTATLVTSATVANRTPQLKIATPTPVTVLLTGLLPAQAASATVVYQWYQGAPTSGAAGATETTGVPPVVPGVNWTVGTSTTGLQVGDQWSAIVLTFAG